MKAVVVTVLTVLVALTAALVGIGAALWVSADVDTVGERRFERELRIPPLLNPHVDGADREVFELHLREGPAELLPRHGDGTATRGVNGPHLGRPHLRGSSSP